MTGGNARARTGWIVAIALLVLAAAGAAWWLSRPWASKAEQSHLAILRDHLAKSYREHPPVADWQVLGVKVASPGLVVSLSMPADEVAGAERLPAVNRLMTAGAICPDSSDPIYTELGRFSIEIHPVADGKPVLVNADCRNVRGLPHAS